MTGGGCQVSGVRGRLLVAGCWLLALVGLVSLGVQSSLGASVGAVREPPLPVSGQPAPTSTPEEPPAFTDSRFNWRTAASEDGRVTVYWYSPNNTLGPSVTERASKSLARIEGLMGHRYNKPISIWVYTDIADLHSAIGGDSRDWVGGQALTEQGVIQVYIPEGITTHREIAIAIPHEVSHLVYYQATYNPDGWSLAWLDEGLAMLNQEESDSGREITPLREAAEDEELIPLAELDAAFRTNDPQKALLAYAQSRSLVSFIVGRYGRQGVGRTLVALRERATEDEAISSGLGITLSELEKEWLASLPYKPRQANAVSSGAPASSSEKAASQSAGQWLTLIPILTCAALVLGLIGFSIAAWVQRRRQARFELEE